MINYSIYSMYVDPRDHSAGRKVYASAQYNTKMTLEKFCEHISEHNSKYHVADVMGVLVTAVYCLREQLLEGKKIELGYLGDFSLTLHCEGATDEDSFSTKDNIKSIEVRWEPGDKFTDLLNDATFNYATTREQQKASKKAAKQEVHESIYGDDGDSTADKDTEPGEQTGDSGSGSGDGDDDGDKE